MHEENRMFWRHCAEIYPRYFNNAKVIELGSFNINGTVRDYFKGCDYTGVDWKPGPCVDVVSLIHNLSTEIKYDTIISASMLEHDPWPEKSMAKMVDLMKPDGVLLLSWGCNHAVGAHCLAEAPDHEYHALKGQIVHDFLVAAGLHIAEFRYTHTFVGYKTIEEAWKGRGSYFIGEILAIAFKDPSNIVGEPIIDEMLPEDKSDYKGKTVYITFPFSPAVSTPQQTDPRPQPNPNERPPVFTRR